MPLDALFLTAALHELRAAVIGARVEKIYQPERDMVVLLLRPDGALHTAAGRERLLLSGGGALPRAHLTALTAENPAAPPMFCMLLRRHLSGAHIVSVHQPPAERVVRFVMETYGDLGDKVEKELILEAVGRQGNLILTGPDGRILDCLRRVEGDLAAGRRHLMPGMFYRLPAAPPKTDPLAVTRAGFAALLAAAPPGGEAASWLTETFAGVSPLIARELAYAALGSADARLPVGDETLWRAWERVMDAVKENDVTPSMVVRDGAPADFSYLPITQYETAAECREYSSFSVLLDDFCAARERALRTRQRGQGLAKLAKGARERLARKVEQQRVELAAAADREELRRCGDLLIGSLHLLEKGMARAVVPDYYNPEGGTTEVALDPLLTPQQNAALYYKRYRKAKTAERMLTLQVEKGEAELLYLDSVLEAISRAEGEADFAELRRELEESGYLKRRGEGKKRPAPSRTGPLELVTGAGLRVSVGRNNLQNDLLTHRQAGRGDLWLHARGVPGAHVILRTGGQAPDEGSLHEAAALAAWFSTARDNASVPVDYTPVRYVKKHPAGRPGMVTFTGERTVWAAPAPPSE